MKMYNNNIHDGLPQSEIRNFLAIQLKDCQLRNNGFKKSIPPWNNDNPYDSIIIRAKEDVKELENRIECYEDIKGIAALIKIMGWKEFDVSDETISYNREWMSFLGTQEEYDHLLLLINED
jgi:hypothetical protein